MNLQENIQRIREMMGIVTEVVTDLPDDSYLTMNIKYFDKYTDELIKIFEPKLKESGGDFVKFKNSIVKGYGNYGEVILQDDIQVDNRYLNSLKADGKRAFNNFLKRAFEKYFNTKLPDQRPNQVSDKVGCDPTNFEILGPIVSTGDKSLESYLISEPGGKVYKIKLPDECREQLSMEERNMYVTLEPRENRIHFGKGVPDKLRGKGLGSLIYLAMIKKLGYITSSMANTAAIKMVYQDLVTNPKYENDLMTLLLQKQILIFDKNTDLNVEEIFKNFVDKKYTDKKSVRASKSLIDRLGQVYYDWYNNLENETQETIQQKIEKYKDLEPSGGDEVYDNKTNKIWTVNGSFEEKQKDGSMKKVIQLTNKDFGAMIVPYDEISRFKVINRQFEK